MGYTHYWNQRRDYTKAQWLEVCVDVGKILKDVQHVQGITLANGCGDAGTSPEITRDRIFFNGVGEDNHETFCLYRIRQPKEDWQSKRGNDLCKTARKPYDLAVTAVLCYLSTVALTHSVSSDGHGADWIAGVEEARRALPQYGNVLDIPREILEDDRWCGPWVSHRTDKYLFRFCVDGKAYVMRLNDGASYCFPTHLEAAQWAEPRKDILHPMGFFDAKRNAHLKLAQTRLLKPLVDNAAFLGRDQKPPAFVRPGEIPPVAKRAYNFAEVLGLAS